MTFIFQDDKSLIYWDIEESLKEKIANYFTKDKGWVEPTEDFERVFERITGVPMGGMGEGKIPFRLELGDTPSLNELSPEIRVTAAEISVSDKAIVIRAETFAGLSGGIYKILEDWGCRWITAVGLGEVIPKHHTLTLPNGLQIAKIGVDTAFGATNKKEARPWLQRNRLMFNGWLPCYHNWLAGVEPKKYFKEHPEYYALVDGVRRATQPETTNPDVIKLKIEHAKEFFRANPTARSYPMDPEDNGGFSESPEAEKLDPSETDIAGRKRMMDRVVHFANAVLEGFEQEFPDKTVGYYSYNRHSEPPVNVKPNPKTIVAVTRFGYCNLRLTPTPNTPSPAAFEDLVKRWLALIPNIYIYEYQPPTWAGALPFPNYLDLAESMRRLHRMGVKGFYSDARFGIEHAPSVFLNSYVRYRMMVNPEQEPQALMEDYCHSFFGMAAKNMERYYDILSKVTEYNNPKRPVIGVSIYGFEELFPRDLVAHAGKELQKALENPKLNDIERKRVLWVKLGHDYLEAFLAGVDAAEAGDYDATQRAFDQAIRLIALQEREGEGIVEMDDARRRVNAMRSKLLATHFPDKQGMITNWKLLGPIPRRSLTAAEEEAIFKTTDFSVGIKIGEETVAWKSYTASSGILDFNKAFERSGLDVPLSKAFAAATVEAPEEISVTISYDCFFPFAIWLNGEKIFERKHSNFDFPDANTAQVVLRKGDNRFVFLCDERTISTPENFLLDGFDWSTSLSIRNTAGEALELKGMRQ